MPVLPAAQMMSYTVREVSAMPGLSPSQICAHAARVVLRPEPAKANTGKTARRASR
jgi:hypothetical protein